jgi:hypothetical protein
MISVCAPPADPSFSLSSYPANTHVYREMPRHTSPCHVVLPTTDSNLLATERELRVLMGAPMVKSTEKGDTITVDSQSLLK